MKNVKCARCVKCGKEYEAVPNLTNCECGGILDIIYDYDYIKAHFTKETLKNRVNPTMWRYRELLPVEDTTPDTPLRVGWSPLYEEPKLAEMLGLGRLWVKDDGINPTAVRRRMSREGIWFSCTPRRKRLPRFRRYSIIIKSRNCKWFPFPKISAV